MGHYVGSVYIEVLASIEAAAEKITMGDHDENVNEDEDEDGDEERERDLQCGSDV